MVTWLMIAAKAYCYLQQMSKDFTAQNILGQKMSKNFTVKLEKYLNAAFLFEAPRGKLIPTAVISVF
jgi:hypothetical protein